jgi:predicted membrane-bound spermidine synthase
MRSLADKDTHFAAALFGISLVFLLFAASMGLTSWPGRALLSFAAGPSLHSLLVLLSGYSFIVLVLFWGTAPSLHAQRTVLMIWPLITAALWLSLHDEIRFGWYDDAEFGMVTLLGTGMAMPALVVLLWRTWRPSVNSDPTLEANLRWLLLMMLLFVLVPQSALDLTVSLHPQTYDVFAAKFDAAAGLNIAPTLISGVDDWSGVSQILEMAYGFTPLAFFSLSLLQLRGRASYLPNALLLWVCMTLCAVIAYHFFPITGPKYAFGPDAFIAKLRDPSVLGLELTIGAGPNPRNGMPSMHFGWMLATLVVWSLSGTRRVSKAILGFMTFCVALATLYLGEHYVIDLVVAIPFVLGSIALCTTSVPWTAPERWRTVGLGFGCWLVWVLLLRTQIEFFVSHQWACWALLVATAVVVMAQTRGLSRFRSLVHVQADSTFKITTSSSPRATRRVGVMFFVSGLAALVYQVLFAKELALVFGSTATATFTVLATFLGGMSIGSLIGGFLARRVSKPVVIYAFVELAIGGFCIVTPMLFSAIQGAYIYLATDLSPESPMLLGLRVALGAGVLLVPTVLMGITLPLLAQTLNVLGEKLGGSVARLYACNTAGAALGALLASYAVIPALGVNSTTLVAALLNLMVALAALELAKGLGVTAKSPSKSIAGGVSPAGKRVLMGAWFALCVGGILSLGLEVVYVHLLSIVAGNSVYAFGLMLATFLVGLALGGEGGRRLIARPGKDLAAWLAATQIVLAALVALAAWGWDMIPGYFASFAGYPVLTSFSSHEAVRGIVCALVMIPPTVCIGLSYTLAMDLATTATGRRGITILGISAALNTFGNIAGVLLFGFLLLPWLGGLVASKLVAVGALVVAVVVMWSVAKRATLWRLGVAMSGVAALVVVSPTRLDYELLSSGANVYFQSQNWGAVIGHAESIDGGLTTVTRQLANDLTIKTLLTNGKFQGNDARNGEVQAQIGFAALPLLHQRHRNNALVIGYGTGATSRVFHDAGFAHIDIAELSRDVIHLANANFSGINSSVSEQPGVQAHITDGRNFLLLTPRKYDIISTEITSIWFAGAASFYNREFYQLARTKLTSDGVLQQWVQLHHMASTDLITIIGTARSEFSFVSLYVVGGQGILIATNDSDHAKPLPSVLAELDNLPQLGSVRELAGRDFSSIAGDLLLSPKQVDFLLDKIGLNRSLWISTDKNLRLEYSTPKANAALQDRSFETNLALLRSAQNVAVESEKLGFSGEEKRSNP